jgi:formyltetrahydrofolate deformylase
MHLLKLHCPDAVGLLARITGFIAASGGNLLDVSQYTDPVSRWFFTRLAFTGGLAEEHLVRFEEETRSLADSMQAVWTLRCSDRPVRTVILVSKKDHCLVDLLWRCRSRELNIELPLVLSNHDDARSLVEREGIRFEKIDFSSDKPGAFAQLAAHVHPNHLGCQKVNWLTEHAGFRFNAAHAPADDAETVDHRRVRIGADESVGEVNSRKLILDRGLS